MKKTIVLILVIIIASSCGNYLKEFAAGYYSQKELETKIERESKDYVLIDLRYASQYRNGHIPTAINIPIDDLSDITNKDYRWFDIVIYHSEISIQRNAFETLDKMGYQNVHMLAGGLYGWDGDLVKD